MSFLFFAVVFTSCSKSGPEAVDRKDSTVALDVSTYKIELLSGLNQKDTVGNPLQKPIRVKAYKNGEPYEYATIKYFSSGGCSRNSSSGDFAGSKGEFNYTWYLNEKTGTQTLRIILCDVYGVPADSLQVTATALAATGNGFYTGACSIGGIAYDQTAVFSKLKSGRIIALFLQGDSYLFSDDNGVSWNLKKPIMYVLPTKMVVAPNGDLYMLATTLAVNTNNYIYVSKDEGNTWKQFLKIDYKEKFADMIFTREGKIIYTTNLNKVAISADEGKTWQVNFVYPSQYDNSFSNITQIANGSILMVGNQGSLLRSDNQGQSWKVVSDNALVDPTARYTFESNNSIYTDSKGDTYIGRGAYLPGIYKLNADNNTTQRQEVNAYFEQYKPVLRISQQKDGYYYFLVSGWGLNRTKNFINSEWVSSKQKWLVDYIVADNNNLIVADTETGLIYYKKQ